MYNLSLQDKIKKADAELDQKMGSTSTIKHFASKVQSRDNIINNFKDKLKAIDKIKGKKSL